MSSIWHETNQVFEGPFYTTDIDFFAPGPFDQICPEALVDAQPEVSDSFFQFPDFFDPSHCYAEHPEPSVPSSSSAIQASTGERDLSGVVTEITSRVSVLEQDVERRFALTEEKIGKLVRMEEAVDRFTQIQEMIDKFTHIEESFDRKLAEIARNEEAREKEYAGISS